MQTKNNNSQSPGNGTEEAAPNQEELIARLAEAEKKAEEFQDKYLRLLAEMDNYKKRVERDKQEIVKFGKEEVLKDFLPFVESLRRAVDHLSSGKAGETLKQGLQMIQDQLECCLRKHGLEEIKALGCEFDPRFHEALFHEESPAHKTNEVMEEIEKGYTLHGRLLKPAKVTVCKGQKKNQDLNKNEGNGEDCRCPQ